MNEWLVIHSLVTLRAQGISSIWMQGAMLTKGKHDFYLSAPK